MLGFVLFAAHIAFAQEAFFDKKYEWNYNVTDNVTVNIENYDCDLIIVSSNAKVVRLEIEVDVEAKSQKDIDLLDNYLQSLDYSANSDLVKLETTFWQKRNSTGNDQNKTIKMKLKNGKTIELSEFKVQANVHIPTSARLVLTSKYSKIELGTVNELELDSYSDKVAGRDVTSGSEVKGRYSEMEFGSFGPLDMDLYDSNFRAEKAGDLNVKSKYSEIHIDITGDIQLEGYQDKMKFERIGDADIKSHYADISCTRSGDLNLHIYDCDLEIDEIGDLTITSSKYSEYKVKKAGAVNLTSVYDDKYIFEKMVSLKSQETKYSDFIITHLNTSFEIVDGYNDNVKIYASSTSFAYLDINSKYSDIQLNTVNNLPLRVDWKTKYGKLDFDEEQFATKIKIEKHGEREYKVVRGNETANMPYVKIRGYNIKMNLRD